MIGAIAVFLAALIAIGCIAGMAIMAGRAWAQSKLIEHPEHLGIGAEADQRKTIIQLHDKTFCI